MHFIWILGLSLLLCSCSEKELPVVGFKTLETKIVDGKQVVDSIDHTIPNFSFINQDSASITEAIIDNKVYIVDFFFTSCPTICPKVKKQVKRVYAVYKDNPNFTILSHSIDTKYDTVGRLAWYADKFKIETPAWHLLTGTEEEIFRMSKEYYIAALADEEAPGGFDHSGAVALVDRNKKIRGLYDGTDPEKIDVLIKDIQLLLDSND